MTYINFEIPLKVFMPNITTNHAITYTNALLVGVFCSSSPINESIHQLSLLIFHCTHYISSHWLRDYRQLILKLIIAVHRLVSYLASFVQVVLAMHDFQTKRAMSKCVPCHGVFFKTVIVVGFDFCDIWNNQGLGKWYHPRLIILKFHSPNGS